MKIKSILTFCVGLILVIVLSACVRPASEAPTGEPTATLGEGEFPVPGGTEGDVMSQLEQAATQTAIALGGTTGGEATQPPTEGETAEVTQESQQQPTATPTSPPPTTPATQVTVPTSTPGIPSTYTLRTGEYPYCIARRYNLNPTELLNLNGLSSFSTVYAGMTLKIPQTGNPFPGNRSLRSHPTTYTVQSGENIYEVACKFGDVSPDAIATANGLQAPYSISAGQTLQIP
jgi:LysM repeat protein